MVQLEFVSCRAEESSHPLAVTIKPRICPIETKREICRPSNPGPRLALPI